MRLQTIQRFVDARKSQGRVVLWLACGHKISLNNFEPEPVRDPVGEDYPCRFCSNPTPTKVQESKPVQQLWREAGEP